MIIFAGRKGLNKIMEEIKLTKGLFGYTQNSVNRYINSVNNEFRRITKERDNYKDECDRLHTLLDSKQSEVEELLAKNTVQESEVAESVSDIINGDDVVEEIHSVSSKSAALTEEEARKEVSEIIIEAKRFANSLKKQAEDEYNRQRAENSIKLAHETEKTQKYIDDLNCICAAINKICKGFDKDIVQRKSELEVILSNVNEK